MSFRSVCGRTGRIGRLAAQNAPLGAPALGVVLCAALTGAFASLAAAQHGAGYAADRRASPELVVSMVAGPSNSSRPAVAGATFEVRVYVRNKGNRTAPRSFVRFHLLRNTPKRREIGLSGQAAITRLKPGQTSHARTTVRVPAATPPGSWRLVGCAFAGATIRERTMGNNCRVAAKPLRVTRPGCQQHVTPDGWASSEERIEKLSAPIPEAPFHASINGASIGATKLLAFASRFAGGSDFPQALVIYSSGYLRVRPASDSAPAFGQSLVLGPAIWASSASFPAGAFFSNPQIQRVDVNTSALDSACDGALRLHIVAGGEGAAASSPTTDKIMKLAWDIVLKQPTAQETEIQVAGTFAFTQQVRPDPTRTSELQSFKLFQISSMYIDAGRHDVDGFRYRDASGPVTVVYEPGMLGHLVPAIPTAIDPLAPVLDSVQSGSALPNGKTPSYRITLGAISGPMAPPTIPRAWLAATSDVNQDNLGLWAYQRPLDVIPAWSAGEIRFTLEATGQPIAPF